MSAKMQRRRRHDRRKRILIERREHREDVLFFATGRFPASATSIAVCSCGARAFARRGDFGFHDDFYEQHAYCDEYDAAEVSS
jgi:hypothetical protein